MKKRLKRKSEMHRLLEQTTTTVCETLNWIHLNLSEHEEIDVHAWYDERYYIVVKDTREEWEYPENMRFGLTVDVKHDRIMSMLSMTGSYGTKA